MIDSQTDQPLRVGVVGAGTMGIGVAEVAARAGHDVVLVSRSAESATQAVAKIRARLDQNDGDGVGCLVSDTALRCLTPSSALSDLAECDLVIECVVEDLETKRDLMSKLDAIVQPDAVIATNTSTLSIIDLAMATNRPAQVCGIHFFNPVRAMPLVEVGRPLTASDETIALATRFAASCGKDPIVVEDRAGFIVNALLFPYLNGAIKMWERGTASMESIDIAMRGGCNFPIGPFALLDLVGLDTSLAILDALYEEFREPACAAAPTLRRKVSAGQLGRKSGSGFYEYAATRNKEMANVA